jgi:hypothetical protein
MQSEQGCRFIHPPPLDRLAVEKEFLSLDATVYQMWKGVVSINLEKEMIDKVPFFL